MDAAELPAWEAALECMHPSSRLPQVTAGSAAALLRLANKYDMPCLQAHVVRFLEGNSSSSSSSSSSTCSLADVLTPKTAWDWLELTSWCGLDSLSDACADYIVTQHLPVNMSNLTRIQQPAADRVLGKVFESHKQEQDQLRKQHSQAVSEAQRTLLAAAWPTSRCCHACQYTWFIKPNGNYAAFCINCGKKG